MAKPNKRKAKQAEAARAAAAEPEAGRRRFLVSARNWGIGAAVVGGVGWLGHDHYQAAAAEYDLDRIGLGTPKVVQVHDPQCALCANLQREARAAVETFADDELCFLIANIRTDRGRAFAGMHGVRHVTLVLLEGAGRRVGVMEGVRSRDELAVAFRRLVV